MDEFKKAIRLAKAHLKPQWHDMRKTLFIESYKRNNGNCNAVARDLGIHRVQAGRYKRKWLDDLGD
jgi:DNA-binding PucR family transcriptional regulator